MTVGRDDWGRYWRDVAHGSRATLADLPTPVQQRLDAPWPRLAAQLPRGARVLDLATGGGIVLAMLKHRRRDLKLTGVDTALDLPMRSGMTLKGGVAVEALPFREASFDAVTSRFGIEYGPLAQTGSEAARVCRRGGRICLVVHHADSEVLRHNRARHAALRWALIESGHMDMAANLVAARANLPLPTPATFRSAPADAAARFPDQSAAAEFLTGLLQLLDAGLGRPGIKLPGLSELAARAEGELSRLEALFAAACDEERLALLTDALVQGGVALAPIDMVCERDGGAPLAWLVEGQRS